MCELKRLSLAIVLSYECSPWHVPCSTLGMVMAIMQGGCFPASVGYQRKELHTR